MIEINGVEGGGQILRTGLSLSCIISKPVKFIDIRHSRPKPGLQPQHLTCVNALQEICNAQVKGAFIGSQSLEFTPGKAKGGDYVFNIGTAGSITLLAQCVLPVLLFADEKSNVTFTGGTHVSFSPIADYFYKVFLPTIAKMGVDVKFAVEKPGWFPKGGGKATLVINSLKKLKPLSILERQRDAIVSISSIYSLLPDHVGQRQANAVAQLLPSAEKKVEKRNGICPGSCVFLKADYGNCVAGFSSLGAIGKSSETVANEASLAFTGFDKTSACVDEHLADQLLLYAALCKEESAFTINMITQHFETNASVLSKFLGVEISASKSGNKTLVSVKRRG